LRDQLQILVSSGNDDSGFPILRNDNHDNGTEMIGMRMVGYISANELEHALSAEFSFSGEQSKVDALIFWLL
jgi:chloride channel 3/4/5